jgi:hypothetical protein
MNKVKPLILSENSIDSSLGKISFKLIIEETSKSRKMRWVRHIARIGRSGMHIGYWWESQKERGGPIRGWVDNIKMDLREMGLCGLD